MRSGLTCWFLQLAGWISAHTAVWSSAWCRFPKPQLVDEDDRGTVERASTPRGARPEKGSHSHAVGHPRPSRLDRERLVTWYFGVGVAGHYSNRPDLLEQLRKVAAIVSDGGQDNDASAGAAPQSVVRSRRLRDRFSPDDLQTMIDLYRSGITATAVAEKFGVSLRSVKRLLRQYGVRRERRG
jgi:helix-turn-helix resolvase-like protein